MPGPPPKPAAQRRRRNVAAGARILRTVDAPKIPELPYVDDVGWHDLTEAWWKAIWASPMAPEFDPSDIYGLYMLAHLVDCFWRERDPDAAKKLAGEIRLQGQRYGLSPLDRRRLQWEIDRADEAAAKTAARNAVPVQRSRDPRLKAV